MFIKYCFNFLLNLIIQFKFLIISLYYQNSKDFDVIELKLYDNSNILCIKNIDNIKKLLSNEWVSIKEYNNKIVMIDILYLYKNNYYNIIFKYPNTIIFPFEIKSSKIKLLYTNDDINDLIMKYSGPTKDFINNTITLNDIFVFNNMKYDKDVIFVNSNLDEKIIKLNDIIDLKI